MLAIQPNSTEPEIVEAFVALTTFALSTLPLWRPDKHHFALIDDAILTEFAQKLIHGIKFHACTQRSHPTINLADGGA
jgi:hypothetical protein